MIYAIGDIHGRFDLLEGAVRTLFTRRDPGPRRVIFLGDYVDRGPQSRAVLERLIALQAEEPAVVCLKGNHEAMMLDAVTSGDPGRLRHWRGAGGDATLRSYGAGEWDDPAQAVPREHLAWIAGLPLTTADEHRIYVHAGLAPGRPFAGQKEDTCLWIREAFLRARAAQFEAHVVHGHTPCWAGKPQPELPELLPHRTNLDTGAFATGVLTIGVFDPHRRGGPVEVLPITVDEPRQDRAGPIKGLRDVVRRPRSAAMR